MFMAVYRQHFHTPVRSLLSFITVLCAFTSLYNFVSTQSGPPLLVSTENPLIAIRQLYLYYLSVFRLCFPLRAPVSVYTHTPLRCATFKQSILRNAECNKRVHNLNFHVHIEYDKLANWTILTRYCYVRKYISAKMFACNCKSHIVNVIVNGNCKGWFWFA